MKSKRLWKKHAHIERHEKNDGDVQFVVFYDALDEATIRSQTYMNKSFESLAEAESVLDAWFADWWPKQTKSRRRA